MIYGDTSYAEVRDLAREAEQQENDDYTMQQIPAEDTCAICKKPCDLMEYVFGFAVCDYCDQPRIQRIDREYIEQRREGHDHRSAKQIAASKHRKQEWYRHLRVFEPKKSTTEKVI